MPNSTSQMGMEIVRYKTRRKKPPEKKRPAQAVELAQQPFPQRDIIYAFFSHSFQFPGNQH